MKAIIPVAGAGKKLRPHTYTQPKALIPIAGKTVLGIIIDQLQKEGIIEFVFVVGYLGDKIRDYVEKYHSDITAHFVQQIDRQGTAHAINLTKEIVQQDEVIVILGDTLCEYNLREVLDAPYSMIGVKKVEDPRNFGVAEITESGSISLVVEKPKIPKSNMALVGIYKIKESEILFSCLDKLFNEKITTLGDYNLTDALSCMLQQGIHLQSFKVDNWFDCGKKDTIIESNATLFKKFGSSYEKTDDFINAIIIDPVSIGKNCVLHNCVIGPNVAIGNNVTIQNSILKESIISSYTKLIDVVLEQSLIGSDVLINGITQSLNIGDNTEIDLR
jgi:glucose-1-phosphate thymidylyltransferase